jgi:purine catabolism regulator
LAQRWLGERFPGSLLHLESELWLLVRLRGEVTLDPLLTEFASLHGLLARELGGLTYVGVGRVCRTVTDYQQGFGQAQEALRVARSTRATEGVAAFDHLGAARYLSVLAADTPTETPRDRYQLAIDELTAHDARRASGLLETLTAFLAAGGNIARTAERLYIHRNTLVQRLDKIQDLTGLDPRESEPWLALQIVLALRQLQREG